MEYTRDKRWILGLLLNCPCGNPDAACPLNKLRKQSLESLLSFVEGLSDLESQSITRHHRKCIQIRENK